MDDPYIWMENLEDPRVLEFINEENRRFREFVGDLSQDLVEEVRRYYNLPNITSAKLTARGTFVRMSEEGHQLIKLLETGEILVDSRDLEKELGDEILLQDFMANEDGTLLAYNFSVGGSDEGITRIVALNTGEVLEEIKPSLWNVIFLKNGYYFARFYRRDKTPDGVPAPAERIFWKDENGEKMVFGEGLDSGYFMHLQKSNDGKWALLTVTLGWNKGEIYLGPIDNPEKWKKVYSADVPVHPIDYVDGKLYIYTREGSGMGKVVVMGEGDVIPEGKWPLEWAKVMNGKILASYMVHASSHLKVFDMKGRIIDEINFDIPAQVVPLDSREGKVLLRFESFSVPYRLYLFDGKLSFVSGVEADGKISVTEDFAKSKDGTSVHYFVVRGEEDKKKAWVFGYGGFNIALLPRYVSHVIPFIKRGGTFVMANLRGGSEYGEEWHRAGMRENKQNVFDDFIAVLEKLKREGYRVIAWGRSNGGLLVSATLVQRPDLMDAAIIGYPVIDMLRFHNLYIGSVWIPEYGNPDTDDREFLLKYSPYHNVKPAEYPLTLVYTGLHDDRVHPAHAFKFARKMKDVGAPVYLRVETKSGHMGASSQTRIRELSDMLAFVLKVGDACD